MMHPRAVAVLGTIPLTLALVPTQARAQVAIGASGGLSLSTLTGNDIDDDEAERRTRLVAGGFASVPLSIDDSELDADVKNSSWFLQAGLGWIVGG